MEKYAVFIKSCCDLKKCPLFCCHGRVRELLSFLKNLEKYFCNLTPKKLRQTHRKFNATYIGRIYRLPISLQEIEIYRL